MLNVLLLPPEFNKFSGSIFATKLKQVNLSANSDVNAV